MALLECSAVVKKYGTKTALDGLDIKVEKGRIVGLLGPNGSGKTTFLKLCNGLLTPTSGEIKIDGMAPGIKTKEMIAYLPERTYLNDWMRVKDLLLFFSDFYKDFSMEKANEMLINLGISTDETDLLLRGVRGADYELVRSGPEAIPRS